MKEITLNSSINSLTGIGYQYGRILSNLSIKTLRDLLWILPKECIELQVSNKFDGTEAVNVTILTISLLNGRKKITKLKVFDLDNAIVEITFFFHSKLFYKGNKLMIHKKGGIKPGDILSHPDWIPGHQTVFTKRKYSIEGVPDNLIHRVCMNSIKLLPDTLKEFRNKLELAHTGYTPQLHDELASIESLSYIWAMNKNNEKTQITYTFVEQDLTDVLNRLKYDLTACQKLAWEEINSDLITGRMIRILYGDVGTGKTVVSALALAFCFKNGFQAALVAPTEILAIQHYNFLKEVLTDIPILLLTGSTRSTKVLNQIKNEICIIVGTHALLQEKLAYYNLRLVVIDEQHRFGVLQRAVISKHHTLLMTATPIPRTFQLVNSGIIPISSISTRPQGHRDLRVFIKPIKKIDEVFNYLDTILPTGNIFWVCPFIQKSPNGSDIENRSQTLRNRFGPLVLVLHGRMSSKDKQRVLEEFVNSTGRILLSTTVIEVGVNIPNANTIIIENSELFGIAQLYQLMGRVGRGKLPGECFFLYDKYTNDTRLRLNALKHCKSGLELAQEDLYIRGFGELLGTNQSGTSYFRFIDESRYHLIEGAQHTISQKIEDPSFVQYLEELCQTFNYLTTLVG